MSDLIILGGACVGHDPEMWFSTRWKDRHEARKVCASCPVTAACARAALDVLPSHGMWAGEMRLRSNKRARERLALVCVAAFEAGVGVSGLCGTSGCREPADRLCMCSRHYTIAWERGKKFGPADSDVRRICPSGCGREWHDEPASAFPGSPSWPACPGSTIPVSDSERVSA